MANQRAMWLSVGLLVGGVVEACHGSDGASAVAPIDSVWLVGAGGLPARDCVPGGFRMTGADGVDAYNEARQSCGVEGPEVRIPWPVSSLAELPHLEADGRRLAYRYDMSDRSIHLPGVAQRMSVLREPPLQVLAFQALHD